MKHLLVLGIAFAAFHFGHSEPPAFCSMPEDEGTGKMFIWSMYFDATSDKCTPFLYKGEGGNGNRFTNERECIRNCSTNMDNIYPMDASKACLFKKAEGECNNKLLRYYYDPYHGKCKKFLWSGCIGNGNRFTDHNVCNSTCVGIHEDGDELEEDEPDTPIAIICGVLLSAIIASILITVLVLTIKSKKEGPNKKAAGKRKEPQSDLPLQDTDIEMA